MTTSSEDHIGEFLKLAEKKRAPAGPAGRIDVKAHLRKKRDGALTIVTRYTRDGVKERAADAMKLSRRESEMAMWQAWKDSGEDPEKLAPLMKSLTPFIKSRAKIHMGRVRMIPDKALMAQYKLSTVKALRTYDPERGTQLNTHIANHLHKVKRYVAAHQNVARIPENRVYKIQGYSVAHAELSEQHKRTPTDAELADHLDWSEAEVARMDTELRGDLVSQNFEVDPTTMTTERETEVMRMFVYELDGEDEKVYRHVVGLGAPMLGTGEIAEKLGIESYRVSRIKKDLAKRLRGYLDEAP
jgi:DNA-directed RNA polymerase specialized sigma subunit